MSAADVLDRLGLRRTPAAATPPPRPAAAPPAADPRVGTSELEERRARLAAEFAELQWDLGGVTYEMASRDHFRLDVLTKQAARLQRVDAELAELERMLKLEQGGAAGSCASCGALFARGSVFCWQCGKRLLEPASEETSPNGTVASPSG